MQSSRHGDLLPTIHHNKGDAPNHPSIRPSIHSRSVLPSSKTPCSVGVASRLKNQRVARAWESVYLLDLSAAPATLDPENLFACSEWTEDGELWVQYVSAVPSTRADAISLGESLDQRLQLRRARDSGICTIREELYAQAFDELIRQVRLSTSCEQTEGEGGKKAGRRGNEEKGGEKGEREGGRGRKRERENIRMGKCFMNHEPLPQFQSRKISAGSTIASLTQRSGLPPVLQITIECAERGLLLLRIRDEARMRIAAYQTLYESSLAFAVSRNLVPLPRRFS